MAYTIFVTNNAYAVQTVLQNTGSYSDWLRLSYRKALNDISSCSIRLVPNSPKLSSCVAMNRLLVYRSGVLQFGGIILRAGWQIGVDAQEDSYQIDALGGETYLDWRIIVPGAGNTYDERTDHSDDLAKDYVYYHCGAGAAVARRFSDLTVEADQNECTSITEQPRYENVLTECQKLARLGGFDFRCVPSATGFEFQTEYPQWGLDRTFANGVNTDAVFSTDRRNFERITYVKDTLGHVNHFYVAGQGEGADQVIRERSTAGDETTYKRREAFENAASQADDASVDNAGDKRLKELEVIEGLTAVPLSTTWLNPWDMGDLVTVVAKRYGISYQNDAKVVAVNVDVDQDGIEVVAPELEAV